MDEWMDGWMDEWMDGWMNGWMDEWMDGQRATKLRVKRYKFNSQSFLLVR